MNTHLFTYLSIPRIATLSLHFTAAEQTVYSKKNSFHKNFGCPTNTIKRRAQKVHYAIRLMQSQLLGAQRFKKKQNQLSGSHQDQQDYFPQRGAY